MKNLLYKLAHRLITSGKAPSYVHTDRFHLHLSILRELELYDEARVLLDHDVGKTICAANLACDELRRDITKLHNRQKQEGEFAESKIVEKGLVEERAVNRYITYRCAIVIGIGSNSSPSSTLCLSLTRRRINRPKHSRLLVSIAWSMHDKCWRKSQKRMAKRTAQDHWHYWNWRREPARVILNKVITTSQCFSAISQYRIVDDDRLLTLLMSYFEQFGDKACCYEDLQPYVVLDGDDLSSWTSFLESVPSSIVCSSITFPLFARSIDTDDHQRTATPH